MSSGKLQDFLLMAAVVILTVGFVVSLVLRAELQTQLSTLEREAERQRVTILDYEDALAEQEEQLEVHKTLLQSLRQEASLAAYDFSQIRAMVTQATQTVDDIKKLEESDQELLAKYSKIYFLNEHYEPENLSYISSDFVISEKNQQIKVEVLSFLNNMFTAMHAQGLSPRVISAFRSFNYQGEVQHQHQVTYGTTETNKFVADQGYSEHQLGTTVDIVNTEIGTDMLAFDTTPEYQWLTNYAHEYGFTLSYPENNAYYAFEPWHWRFVGVALATKLHNEGKHFYDLPQRDIDEFRLSLFDSK